MHTYSEAVAEGDIFANQAYERSAFPRPSSIFCGDGRKAATTWGQCVNGVTGRNYCAEASARGAPGRRRKGGGSNGGEQAAVPVG